ANRAWHGAASSDCGPPSDAGCRRAQHVVPARPRHSSRSSSRTFSIIHRRVRSRKVAGHGSRVAAAAPQSGRLVARPHRDFLRIVGFLGGFVLLATLFIRLGPARILSLLASLRWNFLVLVSPFAAHELVRTLAIRRWLPADTRPSLKELLRIRFIGEAAGALTRTGSVAAEPARAWLLANRGGHGVHGYAAAVGELMANG